ncbi:stage V sporulation protein AC [Alicyclobacillus tolerans]|uniref:stage V sporulation protein AC n=1 Tax=Alicyclobacillus tolerans TaxID=90970 RepID=UPI0009327D63|nr:stage V sporulation protein AC [Alicyclobacillus montanus]QRF23289.1 stage V sporulation protein AC [Alicyclobacillus sp. TC]
MNYVLTTASKNEQKAYQQTIKKYRPAKPMGKNMIRAFLVGGLICEIGQIVQWFFVKFAHFSIQDAGNPTVAVMIFLAACLTALGVYDKFAGWAGAGSAVPVTGFSNTMTSAAMEHRAEGWVAGVGGNMFKLAGPVIVYGVVSAFFVSLIRYLWIHLV